MTYIVSGGALNPRTHLGHKVNSQSIRTRVLALASCSRTDCYQTV